MLKHLSRRLDHPLAQLANSAGSSSDSTGSSGDPQSSGERRAPPTSLKMRWPIADRIQAFVGFILFLTLIYSVRSYNLARDFNQRQLRASVGVPSIAFSFTPDLHGTANIDVKNFGQTVANQYSFAFAPEFFQLPVGVHELSQTDMDKLRPIQDSLKPGWEKGIILPGQTQHEFSQFKESLTPAQYEMWSRREAYVMAFGLIRYEDIWGHKHVTRYCGYFDPDLAGKAGYQGSMCGGLNSMDEDDR